MKKLRSYLKHYLFGLVASCWNAGIKAIRINGGWAIVAAAAPQVVAMPNLREMVVVFAAAALHEAIDYFGDNPLPTRIEDYDPAKLPARDSKLRPPDPWPDPSAQSIPPVTPTTS